MKFKKRGVGLMWTGVILMFITFYPVLTAKTIPLIIVHAAGWIMLVCGALIRGKQKKDQDKLERAMYDWADGRVQQRAAPQAPQPSAWPVTPQQPAGGAQRAEIDALARENAKLRRRLDALEAKAASRAVSRGYTPAAARAQSRYHFLVAGLNYRADVVPKLARRNTEYFLSDEDLLAQDGPTSRMIYEYSTELPSSVSLIPEPQNAHDPNAIAVYVGGHHVGYVPAVETANVKPLIAAKYKATAVLSGGRWKRVVVGDYVERGETRINICVDVDPL